MKPAPGQARQGFSVLELMLAVGIIALLAGVSFRASGNEWRRERVNAQAQSLVGWLEAVRRSAVRGNACLVSFAPALSGGSGSLQPGALLASASEDTSTTVVSIAGNCLSSEPLRVVAITSRNDAFQVSTNASSLLFTPRGTLFNPGSNAQFSSDVEVAFSLNGQPPRRCVRLSAALGLVQIGRNEVSGSGACVYGQGI
ncbi:MAG: GspH/FimT family pseudopilin [Synechococcaceae cyanobacterium]|nr:GspH/FimT family pseudopilin [Synechococcaceae cyanobacterium]